MLLEVQRSKFEWIWCSCCFMMNQARLQNQLRRHLIKPGHDGKWVEQLYDSYSAVHSYDFSLKCVMTSGYHVYLVPCMIIGCCHRYSSPLLMKAEQCPSIETQHLIYCCSLDGCAGSCESHRPAGWFVRPERLWQWRLVFLHRGECMSGDQKLCTTVIDSYILALLEELWHLRVLMNMLFGKKTLV